MSNNLANNSEATLKSAGIQPTSESLETLKGINAAIKNLAASLGEEKAQG